MRYDPDQLAGVAAILVVLLAFQGPGHRALAQPPSAGPAPQEGVLLLRNGQMLAGKINRDAEHYYVELANGRIRVTVPEVELFCRTPEEGYQHKLSCIRPQSVHDHVELAQWCQRHGLPDFAARELADARAVDPTHPLIPLLERRLRLSVRPPEQAATSAEPAAKSAEPAERPPSLVDLDRLVKGMPRGSVETFTHTIQPLLLNNCTTAGCHAQRSASKFQLFRIASSGRPPSRRLTQRNLHAALQWIDKDDPAASLLLKLPVERHGTTKTVIFTDRQVGQYKQLVEWVYQVTQTPLPSAPAGDQAADSPVVQASHMAPLSARSPVIRPEKPPGFDFSVPETRSQPDRKIDVLPLKRKAGPGQGGGRPAVRRGNPLPQFTPVDPFDPEIFNRRYRSR